MKFVRSFGLIVWAFIAMVLLPFGAFPSALVVLGTDMPKRNNGFKTVSRNGKNAGRSLAKRRFWFDTPMTRGQFTNLTNLTVALSTLFFDQVENADSFSLIDLLYNVNESTRAQERNMGIGGFGDVPEYKGRIEYDNMSELYPTNYRHKEYAQGLAIERTLIDDDEYGIISQRATSMGLAFSRTITRHSSNTFNNAFSSSYVGGDGKALCATDHPYSPNDATTQSNKGTSALTDASLTTTRQAMMEFKDSRGNPLNVDPTILLVPVRLEATARVLTQSPLQSGVANNDINVNQTLRPVVSRYLTDTNNWFVIDSRMAKMFLRWFWRVRPEFKEAADSDFNLVSRFRGYMRFSYGWDMWQWIYGHEVA